MAVSLQGMFSWKSVVRVVILILLITDSPHGRSIFFPVKSCTDIRLAEVPIEVYQNCSGKDRVLHCLPNDHDDLGLCCFSITWIEKGRCPYYNNYQGNMDERPCPGVSDCPDRLFKSPLSIHYKGCYKKEQATTPTTIAATTSESQTTTAERGKIPSTRHYTLNNSSQTICGESLQSSSDPTVIVLAVLVVILLIISTVFVILYLCLALKKKDMCCFFSDKTSTHCNGATEQKQEEIKLNSTQPESNYIDH